MTFKQASDLFKNSELPMIEKREKEQSGRFKDFPLRRMAWAVFTDSLHRNGEITDWQVQNWGYPKCIYK